MKAIVMKKILLLVTFVGLHAPCHGMLTGALSRMSLCRSAAIPAMQKRFIHSKPTYKKPDGQISPELAIWLEHEEFKNPFDTIKVMREGYGYDDYASYYGKEMGWSYQAKVDSLERAIEKRNPRIVADLLQAGFDPNTAGSVGNTKLWNLLNNCDFQDRATLQIIKLLLEYGANPNAKVQYCELTCLHEAARTSQNSKEAVALLIEYGADIEARDKDGMTPFDWAAWSERYWTSLWKNDPEIFALLAGEFPVEKE